MERYAGATSQILALQFIEAIMETISGATTGDIEPFVVKLYALLQTPVAHTEEKTTVAPGGATPPHSSDDEWLNTRNRMMFESVQLMHEFTTDTHMTMNERAHGRRNTVIPPRDDEWLNTRNRVMFNSLGGTVGGTVNAMDNFIESLLNSLADEDLECNILQSIWNLLQVNAMTGQRLTRSKAFLVHDVCVFFFFFFFCFVAAASN